MNENSSRFRQLDGEIRGFPLTSLHAFRHCYHGIPSKPDLVDDSSATDFFTESESFGERYGLTTNELTQFRDATWWSGIEAATRGNASSSQEILLGDYFKKLADDTLKIDGASLRPQIRPDDARSVLSGPNQTRFARESLTWLSREFPLDILEASLLCEFSIRTSTTQIDRMLERQFAEVHVHLGASVNFDDQWRYLQGVLRVQDLPYDFLKTPHGPFENGVNFGTWILVGSIIRYLLADFLANPDDDIRLSQFLKTELSSLERRHGLNADLLNHCIVSFLQPKDHDFQTNQERFRRLQSLHCHLASPLQGRTRSFNQLDLLDPIQKFVQPFRVMNRETCERSFLTMGLRRLQSNRNRNRDELFERLFWQTQRIRTLFYRHIVQRQSIKGLVNFTRYYRRIWPSRQETSTEALQFIGGAINNGFGFGLRSYEVRGAPAREAGMVVDQIDQIRSAAKALNSPVNFEPGDRVVDENEIETVSVDFEEVQFEAGLMFHFVKARERGDQNVLSVLGNNEHGRVTKQSESKYRFGDYFTRTIQSAQATADTLRTFPLSLLWLRAIDVCNDELAMPTWLFCRPYQIVIEASGFASQYLYRRFGQQVRPIRPNSHVGEDFSHLLTGLRRIDESMEFLNIGEGDRIGHGLALGTKPEKWLERGPVTMSREERLFDLIWAKESLVNIADKRIPLDGSQFDLEISELVDSIFASQPSDSRPDIPAIQRLRKNLADFEELRKIGFPNRDPIEFRDILQQLGLRNDSALLFFYLTDSRICEDACETVLCNPVNEGNILLSLQNGMRRKVAAKRVTVEVNPTSNLIVANYSDLGQHPIWRLDCPGYSDDIPPVSVCVGSDDPLVFATNLPQEYQRLSDALAQSGFSEVESSEWLDKVRERSLEVRNTLSVTSFAPVTSVSTGVNLNR